MGDHMKTNYIDTRLKDQMGYYNNKCVALRREYYWLSSISIVINAVIPILSMGIESAGLLKYAITVLSASVSVMSSILLLRKTKDTWIKYRSTYEKLEKEKILFENSSGKYATATEKDFILACETIMESEHDAWEELHKTSSQTKEE